MKKLAITLGISLLAMPAMAQIYDNYAGIRLHQNQRIAFKYDATGAGDTKVRLDKMGFGAYIGNQLTEYVNIEFETEYVGADFDKYGADFDYDIWSNMLNVYLFQTFGGAVSPYVGLGAGFSGIWGDVTAPTYKLSDSDLLFSYQAMVGATFALNERVDLNVGLKYHNYGKLEHDDGATMRIDATEFYIGAAYRFGISWGE